VSLRNLSTYRKKRDFEQTAEPSGDTPVAPSKQRRFVIQKHDASRLALQICGSSSTVSSSPGR
jgi:bifunctional non-homologous end joining protein LigD